MKYLYFIDDSNTTCEMLPKHNSRYSDVIWTFPSHPSSVNLFRVVLSGSQPCVSRNTFWFVRGENRTGMPSECKVQEQGYGNFRVCDLTCRCLAQCVCGYLHYRAQFPSRSKGNSGLCYIELIYPGLINPKLVIYWSAPSSVVNLLPYDILYKLLWHSCGPFTTMIQF